MPNTSNAGNKNDSIRMSGSVDYFIYDVNDDLLSLSDYTRSLFGLLDDQVCSLSCLKSQILGIDISGFILQFDRWLNGDSSNIIQVRIIDSKNKMRTIQMKGHLRFNDDNQVRSIYGAYIDVSVMVN